MESLYVLALLACPVGMGLMMWLMMRNKPERNESGDTTATGTEQEIAALRAEVDALRGENEPDRQR